MELLNRRLHRVGSRSHPLPDKAALFLTGQMAHKILISAKGAAPHCLQSGSKVTLKATVLALRLRWRIKHTRQGAAHASSITLSSTKELLHPRRAAFPRLECSPNCSQSARLDYIAVMPCLSLPWESSHTCWGLFSALSFGEFNNYMRMCSPGGKGKKKFLASGVWSKECESQSELHWCRNQTESVPNSLGLKIS